MAAALVRRGSFIVSAKRTPFGAFGGKIKDVSVVELAAIANRAAIEASGAPPEAIDSVITGNILQSSIDAGYISRHAALKAGVRESVPALTINRLCGSGFQSVVGAAQEIEVGLSQCVLAGGAENMSQAPHALRGARWGIPLGKEPKLEDTLWAGLTDYYCKLPMGITAENLAEKYDISREECDRFALSSQERWANANAEGYFNAEIAPVEVKAKKGKEMFSVDEHPRQTTIEKLSSLPPVFKENGTVSAGNASGICDGAGSLVVASEEAVSKYNLTPLARVVGYGLTGVDPTIMGIGPVNAVRSLLSIAGLTLNDIELFEVNEAFAPQTLSVIKELGLEKERTNVNGGAIAMGHPLAASGSRILAHLVHEMRRRGAKYSIGSACIGGGQGIAVLLENTQK